MHVGFIGLGNMGLPIARNLLKAGHSLKVYNRTASRADPLRAEGAVVANSVSDAAAGVEVVITMLSDDHAVEEVVFSGGLLKSLPKGAIHVSMSTIGIATSRKLAEAHARQQQEYVTATVFGRPEAAAAAKLFVVAAGAGEALRKCEPLFAVVGQKTSIAGENPIAANVVKLSGNFLIACVIESLGEAVALIRKYGMNPADYVDFLTSTLFAAPVFKTYGELIAEEKYQPAGFRLQLGLKDVRLAQNAGEAVSVPMPFASLIHDKFVAAIANGMGEWDWSALARISALQAGLRKE